MSVIKFSPQRKAQFALLEARKQLERDDLTKEQRDYYTELSNVDTVIEYGGRDCFYYDQEVKTLNGSKKIGEINVGDFVHTFNEITGEKELKKVSHTRSVKKKTVTINLKCGTKIACTPDHKFYHNGCWVEVKDLLSLWYGDMEENKEVRQPVRG